MKRFLTLMMLLSALLAVCLSGCTSTETIQDANDPAAAPSAGNPTEATDPDSSAEDAAGETSDAESVPDIAIVEKMEITLYLPDEQAESLEEITETVDATPQGVVDALIAHEALPEGVKVNSFSMADNGTETQDGDTVSHTAGDTLHIDLDLSGEFADAAAATGTAGEQMLLGSLVNTMLGAYNAAEITITCDGEPLETGHNVYDEPLTFFELP